MVLGIDEVGRGCLAGPLVIGAVCLDEPIDGIKDSKLLKPAVREKLSLLIKKNALVAKLGWVWPKEIDNLGLTKAMILGIERALEGLNISDYQIIIDGNVNYLKHIPNAKCIVKADVSVKEVGAASIIAKVARDKYMHDLSSKYPKYNFHSNVGYGTRVHIEALIKFGPTILHRRSFKLSKVVLN